MIDCFARVQSSIRRPAAALLSVMMLANSTPAFARTTVDAAAKPWLIVGGIVAFLLLSAPGGVLLYAGWRRSRLGEATHDWPSTPGRVISAEVVKKTGYNDGEYQYWAPEIRYSYEVNGKPYVGETIKFGLSQVHYPSEERAGEWLAPYPVGGAPQVRYDPARPETSALELGQLHGGRWLFAGSILLLAALGPVWFTIWIALEPVK